MHNKHTLSLTLFFSHLLSVPACVSSFSHCLRTCPSTRLLLLHCSLLHPQQTTQTTSCWCCFVEDAREISHVNWTTPPPPLVLFDGTPLFLLLSSRLTNRRTISFPPCIAFLVFSFFPPSPPLLHCWWPCFPSSPSTVRVSLPPTPLLCSFPNRSLVQLIEYIAAKNESSAAIHVNSTGC